MALCLAHAPAGYLPYEALRPAGPHRPWLLAGAVLFANAPDLDFLPGLAVGDPDAFHRGVTHTLGAAVVGAAAVWLLALCGRAAPPPSSPAWRSAIRTPSTAASRTRWARPWWSRPRSGSSPGGEVRRARGGGRRSAPWPNAATSLVAGG